MYVVKQSFSRKQNQKQEASAKQRNEGQNGIYSNGSIGDSKALIARNGGSEVLGKLIPYSPQGYHESSEFNIHEHYEKKVQKAKKSPRPKVPEIRVEAEQIQQLDTSAEDQMMRELIHRLNLRIAEIREALDRILKRIQNVEANLNVVPPEESLAKLRGIIDDLHALEGPINECYQDVRTLQEYGHPKANEYFEQVNDLHDRRIEYLRRCEVDIMDRLRKLMDSLGQRDSEAYLQKRKRIFALAEDCLAWVERKMAELQSMVFKEDPKYLETLLSNHRINHEEIMNFKRNVDECIKLQTEINPDDLNEYLAMLAELEAKYGDLRELSTGRMLDLDSLLAFVRAAASELKWINEKERIEVTRDWSDVNRIDVNYMKRYYGQLIQEMESRDVHLQHVLHEGRALVQSRHPAGPVVEAYLTTIESQWNWLKSLTQCFEAHLEDVINIKEFLEEAKAAEQWMNRYANLLTNQLDRTFSHRKDGQRALAELEEMRKHMDEFKEMFSNLSDFSRKLPPMWQRGERVTQQMPIYALCHYDEKEFQVRRGDKCTLLNNTDPVKWILRNQSGVEAEVFSSAFRFPPPDPRINAYLDRIQDQYSRLQKLWLEKYLKIRFLMLLPLVQQIRGWNLEQFMAMDPAERDRLLKQMNDEGVQLLSEMDPNDPLARRLEEELRLANEHFYNLLQMSQKPQEADESELFDRKQSSLSADLNELMRLLTAKVNDVIPRTLQELDQLVTDHKHFEDRLSEYEKDIVQIQDYFRNIPMPSPSQRAQLDSVMKNWEDLWAMSRMYVERLRACEPVLLGMEEANQVLGRHEQIMLSFEYLPSDLVKLTGVHSQLLELQLTLNQQQPIIDRLSNDVGVMRQHVVRTRPNVSSHPDMDAVEREVQQALVRWENLIAQVGDRLIKTEAATASMMSYRPEYDTEMAWLVGVERTVNRLRDPDTLDPSEYQSELDRLMAEYNSLKQHTSSIEHVNREGGKYIREAKDYDSLIVQYKDILMDKRRKQIGQRDDDDYSAAGATIVRRELEELNKRFAQLASFILERHNIIKVLVQNWQRRRSEPKLPEIPIVKLPEIKMPEIKPEIPIVKLPEIKMPEIKLPEINTGVEIGEGFGVEETWGLHETGTTTDVAKITEHEDEMQMYEEWTETKTQFYELDSTRNQQAGEILTFVESLRQGLIDMNKDKEFENIVSSSKLSLQDAIEKGFVSQSMQDALHSKQGLHDPLTQEPISLYEAIQRGLYDQEKRMLKDPETSDALTLQEAVDMGIVSWEDAHELVKIGILKLPPVTIDRAIEQNLLNVETGSFTGRVSGRTMTLKEALEHDYVSVSSPDKPMIGLTLTDVIEKGYIDADSGDFTDNVSRETFQIRDITSAAYCLLNVNMREFVNTEERARVNLNQAVLKNILNTRQGNYTDIIRKESMSLREAYNKDLIMSPLSLYQILTKDYIDSTGKFIDPGTKKRHQLLDAIAVGLVDADVRHIKDPIENDVISVAEALQRGFLNPRGYFLDEESGEEVSIADSTRKGYLVEPIACSIFDVKGVNDRIKLKSYSFNEAVQNGMIMLSAERIVDPVSKTPVTLTEAADQRIVEPILSKILASDSGIDDLTVFEAIASGRLDSTKGVIKSRSSAEGMSPKEAYRARMINLRGVLLISSLFNVNSTLIPSLRPSVRNRRRKVARTGSNVGNYSIKEAIEKGFLDINKEKFSSAGDGKELTVKEALDRGLVRREDKWTPKSNLPGLTETISDSFTESSQILPVSKTGGDTSEATVTTVKRSRTKESTSTGGNVGQNAALESGESVLEIPIGGIDLVEAINRQIFNRFEGKVETRGSIHSLSFREAVELGLLRTSNLAVKTPGMNSEIDVFEAIERGILGDDGSYLDNQRGLKLPLDQAIGAGVVLHRKDSSMLVAGKTDRVKFGNTSDMALATTHYPAGTASYEENQTMWTFNAANGQIVDELSGQIMSVDEALRSKKILPDNILAKDVLTQRLMSFADAGRWGNVDVSKNLFVDKNTGQKFSLQEAAKKGLVTVIGLPSVDRGPEDALQTTMKQQTRTVTSSKQPLIDGPKIYYDRSLKDLLNLGMVESGSGLVVNPNNRRKCNLAKAMKIGLFNPYNCVVVDKVKQNTISLLVAEEAGLLDSSNSQILNKADGNMFSLEEGFRIGILAIVDAAFSASDAFSFQDELRERQNQHSSTTLALRNGNRDSQRVVSLGDGKEALVKVFRDTDGIEKGQFVDESTGMKFTVKLQDEPYSTRANTSVKSTSSVQAVELDDNAEWAGIGKIRNKRTNQVFPLAEAQRLGLVKIEQKGKEQIKSFAVMRSDINQAIKAGIIDPNTGDRMSIEDAIRARLIDVRNLQYNNPSSGNTIPFSQAVNQGLLDATLAEVLQAGVINPISGEKTSISEAVNMGLINARTGGVMNPHTRQPMTWVELLKPLHSSMLLDGVYDPRKGYSVPLTSAINDDLIIPNLQAYFNPVTQEQMDLKSACSSGLLDERTYNLLVSPSIVSPGRSNKISLLEAISTGFIDLSHKTIRLQNGSNLPIGQAAREGKFPQDLADKLLKREKLSFADAIREGLVDLNEGTFTEQDSGQVMSIQTAVQYGLIDAESVESIEGNNETSITNVLASDNFDNESGRIRDFKSNLYYTFQEAVNRGIIDGNSLLFINEVNLTCTLKEALFKGIISHNGRLKDKAGKEGPTIKSAIESGQISLIKNPMNAGKVVSSALARKAEATRHVMPAENYNAAENVQVEMPFFQKNVSVAYSSSGPGQLRGGFTSPSEAGQFGQGDANKETSSDDRTFFSKLKSDDEATRIKALFDDPEAVSQRQQQFLAALRGRGFDVEKPAITDPSSNRKISVSAALNEGVLDVITGEISNNRNKNRISITKAVNNGLISPQDGNHIMDCLNFGLRDLNEISKRYQAKRYSDMGSSENLATKQSEGGGGKMYKKVITWSGQPSELRGATKSMKQDIFLPQ